MRNEIIKNYMRYLKLGRNFSKNTLDAYYHDLNFLLEYADKNNLVLTEIKLEDSENFSASLHDRGVSAPFTSSDFERNPFFLHRYSYLMITL